MVLVANWNYLDRSEDPYAALAYTTDALGADIICIQEMPNHIKKQIQRRKYRRFYAKDEENDGKLSHLCILVREDFQVGNYKVLEHNKDADTSFLGKRRNWRLFLESHSLSVIIGDKTVRIINCHLPVTGSIRARHAALRSLFEAHSTGDPVILCGDLNTFGKPWYNRFVKPILGLHRNDLRLNELEMLRGFAQEKNLHQVFTDIVTYPKRWQHLDHVLISQGAFSIEHKEVLRSMHKSDHRGLLVDLELV